MLNILQTLKKKKIDMISLVLLVLSSQGNQAGARDVVSSHSVKLTAAYQQELIKAADLELSFLRTSFLKLVSKIINIKTGI